MTFPDPDLLGHLGYALLMLGLILIGQKKAIGWPIRILGEIVWVAIGFKIGMTSVWFWGFVFVVMEAYGWWNWRRLDKQKGAQ